MKPALSLLTLLSCCAAANSVEFTKKLEPMLEEHCVKCHDAEDKKGGLDLSGLPWAPEDAENLQQWIKVFDKVHQAEMPPKKRDQPAPELKDAFLKALALELHQVSAKKQSTEGRVVYRRLNRSEYVHTIQDLLGIDTPLHEILPEDTTANGFDNIGAALTVSAVHMERYLQAADLAIKEATITTPRPVSTRIRTDYEETWHDWNHPQFQNGIWTHSPEGFLGIRWNGVNGPHGELGAWKPQTPDAHYRFRIRARAMIDKFGPNARANDKDRPDRAIMLKIALADWPRTGVTFGNTYAEMSATEFREFEYVARVPAGKTLWLSPYRTVPEKPDERAMVGGICAVIEWVEIEGPLFEEWPPIGHQRLYGNLEMQPANPKAPARDLRATSSQPEVDAKRLLADFLPRCFRRPVAETEAAEYLEMFQEQLQLGRPFDEALRAAYKMALCSPDFLFLNETVGVLNAYALANRLSYGLWSSAPDDTLLALAALGKLSDPAVLRSETERLLSSPKSRRFTEGFLGSWLNLRDIEFTQPDTKLYPEFEQYLQQCMVSESVLFFEELLKNNLSAKNIVHSDLTFLNERLAEHYGVPGVRGETLRKIALTRDSHRGGFLTQGAVLKVSANGTTTSPVVRGAYVLDRILGTPPDLPPKNVPSIEPDIRGATTIREQLEKHRSQPVCAGCHAKMDPPGFALENFDVTGRWRQNYRAIPESAKDKVVNIPGTDIRHYTKGPLVDAAYHLSDGRAFRDVDEFKQLLLAHPESLAVCITEKLLTYLTGATPQFADREVIEAIVQKAQEQDFGIRTILHEVIQSRCFTHK